jgi:hypothetical protein
MAVTTAKSTIVSNYDASPRILTSGFLAGANDTVTCASMSSATGDSANSTYKLCFVPSGVKIEDIQYRAEAMTAGVVKLGVYTNTQQALTSVTGGVTTVTAPGAVAVANADQIFGTGISFAAATAIWTSCFSPTVLNGSVLAANVSKRVWELCNFDVDPFYEFHLVATVTTGVTTGAGFAFQLSWVR